MTSPTCRTFAARALRVTAVKNVIDPRIKWRRSERKRRNYQIRLLLQHHRQRSGFIDTPSGHLCFRVIVHVIDYNCHRPRSDQGSMSQVDSTRIFNYTTPSGPCTLSASRAVFFQSLLPVAPSPACLRCLSAPTHLIQMSGALSGFSCAWEWVDHLNQVRWSSETQEVERGDGMLMGGGDCILVIFANKRVCFHPLPASDLKLYDKISIKQLLSLGFWTVWWTKQGIWRRHHELHRSTVETAKPATAAFLTRPSKQP